LLMSVWLLFLWYVPFILPSYLPISKMKIII